MWPFFVISMLGICISIVYLIRKFAAKSVELIVRVATAYGWLTAMMVIALVPIDVWAAYTLSKDTMPITVMWNIAYWSTQAATWLVLPFYQVYAEAGDFSIKNKCLTSLKENALLYGSVGALGLIGVIIILASTGLTSVDDLKFLLNLAIFASNTFGLVVGLLLMGYGLVEIPRSMWLTSNPEIMLKWCAHRCGKHAESVMKSTHELETVVTIITANERQMRRHDPLRPYIDLISNELEKQSPIKPSQVANQNIDIEGLSAEDLEYNYDKKGLADLRRRMMYAVADYQGDRVQYEHAMIQAFELEDIIKCRSLREYTPRLREGQKTRPWTQPVWLYQCVYKPYMNKVFAVLLGVLGCCLVWSECVIPVTGKDLSPFSHIIRGTDMELFFQILTVLPLVYMCACSYYALFKINAFNYNKLIEGATTGAALMQNGSLMCRFAAPTCWNFYHIIRFAKDFCPEAAQVAGSCQLTVFSQIMASMADVTKTFQYFNTYLPVVLVVHCAMVALGIWDWIFSMCVSSRYKFNTHDVDDEYTEKGRLLIRKEQEAALKGFKIGEVLHSAYFDLEFPTIANAGKGRRQKKGFFGGLFHKKLPPASGPAAPPKPVKPQSAATAAASRWVRGATPEQSTSSLVDVAGHHAADNPSTALLSAKVREEHAHAT
ncbi:hypothetical protein CEUSTIGMA_g5488.t1 [Chlamydomonas eustigma]|uniref:LMBR1-like membrane protein n=1 Tax=Chlamydomonas eustigma TaxID=1157962 RepID=A0A250X4R4_9CHLO|nr:hypothetical protein CEUSTIGMA_g5488.t1 [Chlamydomonas eustigma]|eukprot:GAX78046.1 hypothetical protein CEUSTIGMA_g5488.t1 [Chlamydomonas eustigma]